MKPSSRQHLLVWTVTQLAQYFSVRIWYGSKKKTTKYFSETPQWVKSISKKLPCEYLWSEKWELDILNWGGKRWIFLYLIFFYLFNLSPKKWRNTSFTLRNPLIQQLCASVLIFDHSKRWRSFEGEHLIQLNAASNFIPTRFIVIFVRISWPGNWRKRGGDKKK